MIEYPKIGSCIWGVAEFQFRYSNRKNPEIFDGAFCGGSDEINEAYPTAFKICTFALFFVPALSCDANTK